MSCCCDEFVQNTEYDRQLTWATLERWDASLEYLAHPYQKFWRTFLFPRIVPDGTFTDPDKTRVDSTDRSTFRPILHSEFLYAVSGISGAGNEQRISKITPHDGIPVWHLDYPLESYTARLPSGEDSRPSQFALVDESLYIVVLGPLGEYALDVIDTNTGLKTDRISLFGDINHQTFLLGTNGEDRLLFSIGQINSLAWEKLVVTDLAGSILYETPAREISVFYGVDANGIYVWQFPEEEDSDESSQSSGSHSESESSSFDTHPVIWQKLDWELNLETDASDPNMVYPERFLTNTTRRERLDGFSENGRTYVKVIRETSFNPHTVSSSEVFVISNEDGSIVWSKPLTTFPEAFDMIAMGEGEFGTGYALAHPTLSGTASQFTSIGMFSGTIEQSRDFGALNGTVGWTIFENYIYKNYTPTME